MSLSRNPTLATLNRRFVCGVRDITGQPYAGMSGNHMPDEAAAIPRNGAGPHNLQLFVLAPDGTVLHGLPGYWNSTDLATELAFADELYDVYRNRGMTPAQKAETFRSLQLGHIALHSDAMVKRSRMERFDMRYEARYRPTTSDTIRPGAILGHPVDPAAFKTTDVILHQRMATRPFQPYTAFDVASFSDYGPRRYDMDNAR